MSACVPIAFIGSILVGGVLGMFLGFYVPEIQDLMDRLFRRRPPPLDLQDVIDELDVLEPEETPFLKQSGKSMSRWKGLGTVPKDGSDVLLWVPEKDGDPFGEGMVVTGTYDAPLNAYFVFSFGCHSEEVHPIAWMPSPRGPSSMDDIDFDEEAS